MSKKKTINIMDLDNDALRASFPPQWRARLLKLSKRKENRMSINKFCKAHGIDRPVLYRFFSGERSAPWCMVAKIERALEAEGV